MHAQLIDRLRAKIRRTRASRWPGAAEKHNHDAGGTIPGYLANLKDIIDAFPTLQYETLNDASYLAELDQELLQCRTLLSDDIRKLKARTEKIGTIYSWNSRNRLTISIMDSAAPWRNTTVKDRRVPGMITYEEKQYYTYIGQFYSGKGKTLELGPWLGASTHYIIDGLTDNPNFATEKLYVVDDFVWRSSWMDSYVSGIDRLPNHADFSSLFEKHTRDIADRLIVRRNRLALYDGNDNVPLFQWTGGPIEIIYVDCGRTYEANEAWYSMLHGYFIPEVTLIIMQDWRLHREIPVRWYNQTKQFTDSKGAALQLVHEVNDGGIASFLYRGSR